jgi:hypothetical protein
MRDNFNGETFALTLEDTIRSTPEQALHSEVGTVFFVRSVNVPERGDHYIVIKGAPVQKPHGLRPETLEYPSIGESPLTRILDDAPVLLLQLKIQTTQRFYEFYQVPAEYRKKIT